MDNIKWKEFEFDDINLKIINSKAYHSANITECENSETGIPYLTRTQFNNSFNCCVKNGEYKLNPSNTISFGAESACFFYQPYKYITGNKMYYIQNEHINKYIGLFLRCSLQSCVEGCFSFGNGMIPERVKKKKIMLPINHNEEPNWGYMEQYMITLEAEKKDRYICYCKFELTQMQQKYLPDLESVQWRYFLVNDVFHKPQRGKRIVEKNHIVGNTPLVSSYGQENGVTNFIGNEEKVKKFTDCLSIANGGSSAGKTFYHPYTFIAADHVTQCWNKELNKYQYLFLATVMTKALTGKYSFSHEISDPRLTKERIMLPVTESGEPNYNYMEQYIKNLMIKKYQSYLDYVE